MKKTRLRYKKFSYSKRGSKNFPTPNEVQKIFLSNEVFSFFTLIINIFFEMGRVVNKALCKLHVTTQWKIQWSCSSSFEFLVATKITDRCFLSKIQTGDFCR